MKEEKNGDSSMGNSPFAHRLYKLRNRRYYLVKRLKDRYYVDTRSLTISTPFHSVNEIPTPDRYYVRQLLKTGFTHQLTLF